MKLFDIFNANGHKIATVCGREGVIDFTMGTYNEVRYAIRLGKPIRNLFRVYEHGIYDVCDPIVIGGSIKDKKEDSISIAAEIDLKMAKDRIEFKSNVKRASDAAKMLSPKDANTKRILGDSVFVPYSLSDRCAKCALYDTATDEKCAIIPCEGGYFRLLRTKSSGSEY